MQQEPSRPDDEKPPEHQWLIGLQQTFGASGFNFQELFQENLPPNLPPWWLTALGELSKSFFGSGPRAEHLPEAMQASAAGNEIGRTLAFIKLYGEAMTWFESLQPSHKAFRRETLAGVEAVLPVLEIQYREMVAGACDRPHAWMVEFYRGFADGLARGMIDDNGQPVEATTHCRLYLLLLCAWRKVEAFRTQPGASVKLHRWVGHMMGSGFSMDIESFRKFCQRLRIRFGRGGRPRKNCDMSEE